MDFELEGKRFDWEAGKAADNERKHGVSFFEAAEVFFDPNYADIPDLAHSSHLEERDTAIGYTRAGRFLRVTYRELEDGAIHIISAREAGERERRKYEEESWQ
jgi:uncharacterized DUF497 family protein